MMQPASCSGKVESTCSQLSMTLPLLLLLENEDFARMKSCCRLVGFSLQLGKQKHCTHIRVFSDNEVEGNEQLTVELTTEHPLVSVQDNVATVTITDDASAEKGLFYHE